MSESININYKKLFTITTAVVLSTVLVFFIVFVMFLDSKSSENTDLAPIGQNGTQTVNLIARGGYKPLTSYIRAGQAATLNVQTNGTYDCSAALTIPKLSVNKTLPATGTTSFNIPPQEKGSVIQGSCSMGMYSFQIVVQ